MKKGKLSEHQIVASLKKQEAGITVKDISREMCISEATFYNWKAKYGGMEASDVWQNERPGTGERRAQKNVCGDQH